MALEHSSSECDMDTVADSFDELYDYIDRFMDDNKQVNGGITFRMEDGRGISVGLCLLNVDKETL